MLAVAELDDAGLGQRIALGRRSGLGVLALAKLDGRRRAEDIRDSARRFCVLALAELNGCRLRKGIALGRGRTPRHRCG